MFATSIGSRSRSLLAAAALALVLIPSALVSSAAASQDAGAFITTVGTQGIQSSASCAARQAPTNTALTRLDAVRRQKRGWAAEQIGALVTMKYT